MPDPIALGLTRQPNPKALGPARQMLLSVAAEPESDPISLGLATQLDPISLDLIAELYSISLSRAAQTDSISLGLDAELDSISLSLVGMPDPIALRMTAKLNIFWLKNSKDNAPWCYSVFYNANTACLQCDPQCKHSMYTVPAQCFSLGLVAELDPAALAARPRNIFLLKTKKTTPPDIIVSSTVQTLYMYSVVHDARSLCSQYMHNIFSTPFKI